MPLTRGFISQRRLPGRIGTSAPPPAWATAVLGIPLSAPLLSAILSVIYKDLTSESLICPFSPSFKAKDIFCSLGPRFHDGPLSLENP